MKKINKQALLIEFRDELIKRLEQVGKPVGLGIRPGDLFIEKGHIAATVHQVFGEYEKKLMFMDALPFKVGDYAYQIRKDNFNMCVDVIPFKIHEVIQDENDVHFYHYQNGEVKYSFSLDDIEETVFNDAEKAYDTLANIKREEQYSTSISDKMYDEWDFVE